MHSRPTQLRARTQLRASARGIPLVLALAALLNAPLAAQELAAPGATGPGAPEPGMLTVACGEVSAPPVALTWQEATGEDSRTSLAQPEATLLLTNRTSGELIVEVEVTVDMNAAEGHSTARKLRLPAVRLGGEATQSLTVGLEELRQVEAGTGFVAAHAWISDSRAEPRGQSASPVLYVRAERDGGLSALGEAAQRQQASAEVLALAATTGAPGIPPGVTLEMAFEAGQGEWHGPLDGPDAVTLQQLERSAEHSLTMDSETEEIDR